MTMRIATIALLAAALPATARADDVQLWATGIVQGPITPGTGVQPMVWLEAQPRIANDISNLNPMIGRVGFGARLGPDFNALFGYHVQLNNPVGGRATTEHRIWQQLTLPLYRDPENFILLSRWRLEQRTIEGAQDFGWRGRLLLRAQIPLDGQGTAGPLLWTEALVGFNDTDWGQRSGVGQVRAFAGALVPLNRRLNLEAGYMAQIERNPGATRVNHVANITMNYRIGN